MLPKCVLSKSLGYQHRILSVISPFISTLDSFNRWIPVNAQFIFNIMRQVCLWLLKSNIWGVGGDTHRSGYVLHRHAGCGRSQCAANPVVILKADLRFRWQEKNQI